MRVPADAVRRVTELMLAALLVTAIAPIAAIVLIAVLSPEALIAALTHGTQIASAWE